VQLFPVPGNSFELLLGEACPALPMATTQMTVGMPMVMPSTVKILRILFRHRVKIADRK